MINLLRRVVKMVQQRELPFAWYSACAVTALLLGGLVTTPILLDVVKIWVCLAVGIIAALTDWPRKSDLRQIEGKFYFQEFSNMSIRVRGIRLLAMLLLFGTLLFGYQYLYFASSCFLLLNALVLWRFEKRNDCEIWRGSLLRKRSKQQPNLEQPISR